MTHDWKTFDVANRITKQLIEAQLVDAKDELKVRGIIQIALEDKPTLLEILARIDWRNILTDAIKNRPSSWGENPVREWRNAGDTVYCALISELRKRGYVR